MSQNKYDAGRARVVIYNYDNENNVSVDLRSVLKVPEAYRIHSSFGLFNNPLVTGLYDGSDVIIPMDEIELPQGTGIDGIEAAGKPHKTFGVFVITHGICE
ncbi:MAG: hypothetical protein SPLUMA2_SPLUMAMAG2_00569 [uncultured Sulfurimonas sp.]|nr:MAG: hypothetical protein SPLUMA1_SPLUMAMAG1_01109 [uncultured Sulfurimonas sp.]CAI6155766.1 MAG: hypothetical protein SPLUMA2_SPLUMAMAG2_00569 [uncultured Sulfurimonas sp.]